MRRAAIILLGVVLVLGIGAYVATRRAPPSAAPATTWLSEIEPERIEQISVMWSPEHSAMLRPTFSPDLWVLEIGGQMRPVRAERVRGAIRLLAELDKLASESQGKVEGGVRIGFLSEDHKPERWLTLSTSALGGKSLVAIENAAGVNTRVVLADSALAGVFTPESLPAWAERTVFTTLGPPDRVRVERMGAVLSLARRAGGWSLQQPLLARADAAACEALVASLTALQPLRELHPTHELVHSGLSNPHVIFQLETEVRVNGPGGVQARTLVQSVRIGAPASADGAFADVAAAWREAGNDQNILGWSRRIVVLPRAAVEAISTAPGPLLSRVALVQPAADIRELWLSEADAAAPRLKTVRGLAGWESGAPAHVMDALSQQALGGLLALLCDTPAAAATLEVGEKVAPFGVVEVVVNGTAATRLQLGTATLRLPAGAGEALVVSEGQVHRLYPLGSHEAVGDWLREKLRPEG